MGIQIPRRDGQDIFTGPPPTVRNRPLMDATDFGGGPGTHQMFGAVRETANEFQRIAQDAHDRAEEAQHNELVAQLSGEEIRLRTNLEKVKGRDALQASDRTLADFDKFGAELSRQAKTERGRARIASAVEKQRIALQGYAEPYAAREMEGYELDSLKARVNGAKELAWKDTNPLNVALRIDDQAEAIRRAAALTGKPKEWVDNEILKNASETNAGVVARFLDAGDYDSAKEHFDASVKDGLLSARDQEGLSRPMELGQAKSEARRIYSYTGSQEAALDEANKIKNEDVREDVKRRIRNRYDEEDAFLKDVYKNSFTEAMGRAGNRKLEGESAADVVGLKLYGSLKKKDQREVDTYFRQTRGLEAAETDWAAYYALRDMASRDETRGEFLDANLMEYAGRLRPQELEQMINLQTGLRDKKASAIEEADGYRSTSDIVNASVAKMRQAGHIGRKDEAEEEVFKRIVDDEVRLAQKNSPSGKVKKEEVEAIVDGLTSEIVLEPGTFWGKRGPAYKKRGQVKEAMKTVIPEAERKSIEEALRRKGQPVSDSSVIELFKMKMEQEAKNAGR